jgi:hypothetical protein
MPTQLTRLGLTVVFALSTVTAEAAFISIDEISTGGGGTLVHDGSGDVSSSDGSAGGPGLDALLLSSYGITDANLLADLAQFSITGLLTDDNNNGTAATSASLTNLWLIGTLSGSPLPVCSTCGFLDDVNLGSSLSFDRDPVTNDPLNNTQNVLFAIPFVGSAFGPAPWVGPSGLPSPQIVPIGQTFTYALTPAQITFIGNRMAGFSVDQVRFGLSATAFDIPTSGLATGVAQLYDLQGPGTTTAPEPGSLLLLATGVASAGLWRRRRTLARRSER